MIWYVCLSCSNNGIETADARSRKTVLGPVHTAPVLYENGEKDLQFCESVYTDRHKKRHKHRGFRKRYQKWISTKTDAFENTLDQCEHAKTEVLENAQIFSN